MQKSEAAVLASDIVMEVRASRNLTADHVARLERILCSGDAVDCHELDVLFLLDRYAVRADARWTRLLARAVLTGMVSGIAPAGVLNEEKADWLVEKIGRHRLAEMRNLELIVRVMARCQTTPAWLEQMVVELAARHHVRGARSLQSEIAAAFSRPSSSTDPVTFTPPAPVAQLVTLPLAA